MNLTLADIPQCGISASRLIYCRCKRGCAWETNFLRVTLANSALCDGYKSP